MALLWADSFEHQDGSRYIFPSTHSGTFPAGRVGGVAAAAGGATDIGPDEYQVWQGLFSSVSTDTTVMAGMAFKLNENPKSGSYILTVQNTSGVPVLIVQGSTGSGFRVLNSKGTVATAYSGVPIVNGTWYYLEAKTFMDPSVGTMEMWVNGQKTGDTSGTDTSPSSGSTNLYRWEIGGGSYFHRDGSYPVDVYRIDDLYIFDGSGTAANDIVGDAVVNYMLPTSDVLAELTGDDADQVDNYDNVNETIPSGADYNEGALNSIEDIYGFTQLSTSVTYTVHAAQLWGVVAKEVGGNAYGRIKAVDPIGSTLNDAIIGLSTSYVRRQLVLTTNPTGSTWTTGRWNDFNAGFQVWTSTST